MSADIFARARQLAAQSGGDITMEDAVRGLARRAATNDFYEESQPIIREMCRVKLLFTRPWFVIGPAGKLGESGETWTDDGAKKLYDQYAASLVTLREIIWRRYTDAFPHSL